MSRDSRYSNNSSDQEEPWPRWVRISARILCPFVLVGTFVCMEIALAGKGDLTRFVSALRWFIYSTIFTPFFLGVLLGHWFHPVPRWYNIMDRRVYRNKQFIPPLILLAIGGIIMLIGWKVFNYQGNNPAPSYLSFIMVNVGIVLGAIIWPVRVLLPIFRRRL